ncbi:DNA cytosine methyltransferase [Dyella sp.]|uniref:DNA cytosine methyltransferase n=1 Tax=Dyella sp. TaxID=1869338 RepID=UPI003F7DCBD0
MIRKLKAHNLTSADFWSEILKMRRWPSIKFDGPVLRIADLFCGCGGLTLGAFLAARVLRRPFEIELAVDNWPEAIDVYRDNFGRFAKKIDISDLGSKLNIPSRQLDVVVAGPPCQGHSDLNNSTRRVDARNELYTVPAEFAIKSGAKIVLIENVPAVVHSSQGVVLAAEKILSKAGYAVIQIVVDTSNLGVPQKRKRHLLVGSRVHNQSDLEAMSTEIDSLTSSPRLIDFIDDLQDVAGSLSGQPFLQRVSKINQDRIDYLFDNDLYDLPNHLRPPCHRDKPHSYASMYGRLRPNVPAQTLTSGFGSMGQGRFVHPTRRRTITPQEAARIQGFPDFFSFKSVSGLTALRDMIANAVPAAVSAFIIAKLVPTKMN